MKDAAGQAWDAVAAALPDSATIAGTRNSVPLLPLQKGKQLASDTRGIWEGTSVAISDRS
jgi:hypothetical protein